MRPSFCSSPDVVFRPRPSGGVYEATPEGQSIEAGSKDPEVTSRCSSEK